MTSSVPRSAGGDGAGLLLLPGSHLFPLEHFRGLRGLAVFMAEDVGLCTNIRHHQQKIVLFLSAMRAQRDRLRRAGFEVLYHELGPPGGPAYFERLEAVVQRRAARELVSFEIEDRFFEGEVEAFAERLKLRRRVLPSPMFLTRPDEMRRAVGGRASARMADFYRRQRERRSVLVEPDGGPVGGRWSFDTENREKLPAGERVPPAARARATAHVRAVSRLVAGRFGDHPGTVEGFAWPTTRGAALRWLAGFIEQRLERFGPYEDAIARNEPVLFHSRLSALLNCGLVTPAEVLSRVLARAGRIPIASLEGFVRQLIGWREFVRAIDLVHGERQARLNAWGGTRRLRPCWWTGGTGVPPLDDAIAAARATGWVHHIQRLMVAGNLMNLCGVAPAEAWRWFMEMFIDSAEWVMGPNVYGMGLMSDGGIFATKPYICGSNYLLKMSDHRRGDWCDGLDGLYWGFVERHRNRLRANPRTANSVLGLERLAPSRRERIMAAGLALRDRLTEEGPAQPAIVSARA